MTEAINQLLTAISHPTRFHIIEILLNTERPLHIRGLAKNLGMDYAQVYRHIERLEEAGLIEIYDVGRSRVPHVKNEEEVRQLVGDIMKLSTVAVGKRGRKTPNVEEGAHTV